MKTLSNIRMAAIRIFYELSTSAILIRLILTDTVAVISGMARKSYIARALTAMGVTVMFFLASVSVAQADDWVKVRSVTTSQPGEGDATQQLNHDPGDAPDQSGTGPIISSTYVLSQPEAVPPFPIRLSQFVRSYVADYRNSPDGLQNSFDRSQPFLGEMVRLMRNKGLPDDLVYLAFAESAFAKGGKGPWQFTGDTARRFGLHINSYVDERRDPLLSTRAAAEYLANLHDASGGDWPMTVIAWNNGAGAIDRYWSLRGPNFERFGNLLPRRTRSLFGRFMAVAYIARHADDYGITAVDLDEPVPFRTLRVRGGTALGDVAFEHGTSLDRLHELNPALLRDIVPPYARTYAIRVPIERHAFAGSSADY